MRGIKKLRAFTIVELIVVMIISIITLVTGYTVYLLVKKQFLRQSDKMGLLNNYLQFKNTFSSDFYRADSVKVREGDRTLDCYIDSALISYEFSDRTVIRNRRDNKDTFLVFPHDLNITVLENGTEYVNRLSVKIMPYTDTVLLQLQRDYDANSLIKIKPD
jgi:hypothetical protein